MQRSDITVLKISLTTEYLKYAVCFSFSTENPQHAKSVERNMMELNRSVVLECPQLDVPWFHEQFCVDNIAGSML